MRWFRNLFDRGNAPSDIELGLIQNKFSNFLALLNSNNRILKTMSDMEEKSRGDYLFDINYIRTALADIRSDVGNIITCMTAMGGDGYKPLLGVYRDIDSRISQIMPGGRAIEMDDFTLPFSGLSRDKAFSVGSKSAQLGELKTRLGLPVPDGFAISAWAYKNFIEANDLQHRINELISSLDFKQYQDLLEVSEKIQAVVSSSPVPEGLSRAILESAGELHARNPGAKFAVRSSAIGEDTQFSFAGQYRSLLNVRLENLVDAYRDVLAGKFTPQAIYYMLSHSLSESELAMCAGCVTMVDARASGVVYTRDPVNPDDDCIMINSIYGLGKYLVDGRLCPDVFCVSRRDCSISRSEISHKPVYLSMSEGEGVIEREVPEERKALPSINEDQIRRLAEYAVKIEDHYGCPQDIEWAVDQGDNIVILQTRPLHVFSKPPDREMPDTSGYDVILKGGFTISPGAGGGEVYRARSTADLKGIPEGAVLFAPNSFPGIVTVMDRISALVTEVGGIASHMATIAREYRVPAIGGLKKAGFVSSGEQVTVDATNTTVYRDIHPALIEAFKPEKDLFADMDIFALLDKLLENISPLKLVHPSDPEFKPENCRTLHDITRFCHQRAMEEMFYGARDMKNREDYSLRLKTDIPLKVNIIYIDKEYSDFKNSRWVDEKAIHSESMQAFWDGILKEGWPAPPGGANIKGFMGVLATSVAGGADAEFAEDSFAIIAKDYMVLSLRMGYHFSTIEAMASDEISKNYIRFQFKSGGAAVDRRMRRIKIITDILSELGFENDSKGDFLDARISYYDGESIRKRLFVLGRLTMLTKQLDMALSNDSIAEWYKNDIMKKLDMIKPSASHG